MIKNGVKITFLIMVITIASRFLGLLRETVFAKYFGAGIEADAFLFAYMIPSILFTAIASSIGTTFIPIYSKLEKEAQNHFTNNLITITGVFSICLIILGIVFVPYLVKILGYGFSEETVALTCYLSRILLLTIFFIIFNAIVTAKLQSNNYFLVASGTGIPLNIIAISYLIIFNTGVTVNKYAWVFVVAAVIQSVYLLPALLKLKWRYSFTYNWNDNNFRKVLILSVPVLIGSGIAQINIIIDRMLASSLIEGSISALHYASRVNQLSLGITAAAIISFLYPKISKYAVNNEIEKVRRLTSDGIKSLIIVLLPITIGGIVLANPIIKILFERGAFNSTDTYMTVSAFIFYSIGLLGNGIRDFLNITYFSLEDTSTPMKNGILALIINIILNLILIRYMQHTGLALATSISLIFSAILLFRGLIRKIEISKNSELYGTFIKSLLSSVIMAVFIHQYYYLLPLNEASSLVQILWLLSTIIGGVIIYLIFSLLFRQSIIILLFHTLISNKK